MQLFRIIIIVIQRWVAIPIAETFFSIRYIEYCLFSLLLLLQTLILNATRSVYCNHKIPCASERPTRCTTSQSDMARLFPATSTWPAAVVLICPKYFPLLLGNKHLNLCHSAIAYAISQINILIFL